MKRLISAAGALALLVATGAHAEDQHPKGEGGQPHGPANGGGHPGGGHSGGGAPQGGENHASAPHMDHAPSPPPAHAGPVPYVPPGRNDHPHNESAPVAGPAASSHLGHHNFGAPGFTPQSGDRPRYDPQHFPRQINANKHFAWRGAREWQDQPGYHYRRWGYGDYLPAGWFVAQFWIDDYFDYDLPVPPYGYEWVRSGPDALLVDTYTGEVVEAVYGVF